MAGKATGRRELVVEAARRAFTAGGYEATAVSDIASALGISKAAVSYYFPTKETFLEEFVTPLLDELAHAVQTRNDDRDTTSSSMLADYFDVLLDHHDIACWVDTDPAIQNHDVFGGRLAEINDALINEVTGNSVATNDRARALAVLGGIWRPVRKMTVDDLREHADEIVEAALASY